MCFVLYIATPTPLPIIPWNDQTRGIHTEQLSEHDKGVAAHFRHPHVCYIGSDTHCGCGFRNATYQNGSWPAAEWRPEEDTSHIEAQPNHQRLVEFIQTHLSGVDSFELYGRWEGDIEAPALSDQSIAMERLLDLEFYFRDRGHYSVRIDKGESADGGNAG